ncbi:hypothetical protein ACJW30_01G004000 [Castanea mollissima]
MDSSQGSVLSSNVAGLVVGSSAQREVSYLDGIPIYVKELIAGGAADAFAKTTVAPLERIKILLQICSHAPHEFWTPKHARHLGIEPITSSFTLLLTRGGGTGPLIDLLAGSAAGGAAVLCTYPLDLARTKLACQVTDTRGSFNYGMKSNHAQPAYSGIKDVLRSVYKEGGARGLYRGVGPTLTGILPYASLKFYIYKELKRCVPEEHQTSIMMRLSCGAFAGLFGQTFTYPLDVVRRQMQVENLQPSFQGSARYRNTWEGLTTIVHNQGWRQLFAGLSINYIKIVPSVAIGFTAYDMMKFWLRIPPRQKTQSISAA